MQAAENLGPVACEPAGGQAGDVPAFNAELNSPTAVAADGSGNGVIADGGNSRVRVIAAKTGTFYGQPMTAGDIYTIAGDMPGATPGTAVQAPAPNSSTLTEWPWTVRGA